MGEALNHGNNISICVEFSSSWISHHLEKLVKLPKSHCLVTSAPSSGTKWSVSDCLCKNELRVLQCSAGFLCKSFSVCHFTCCLTSGSGFDKELQHESRKSWCVPVQPICKLAREDQVNNTFWVLVFYNLDFCQGFRRVPRAAGDVELTIVLTP